MTRAFADPAETIVAQGEASHWLGRNFPDRRRFDKDDMALAFIGGRGFRSRLGAPVSSEDLVTWQRVDRAIREECERLCRRSCFCDRCTCRPINDPEWRARAIRSLQLRALDAPRSP